MIDFDNTHVYKCPKCLAVMTIRRLVRFPWDCKCDPNQSEDHLEVECLRCDYTMAMKTADAKIDS